MSNKSNQYKKNILLTWKTSFTDLEIYFSNLISQLNNMFRSIVNKLPVQVFPSFQVISYQQICKYQVSAREVLKASTQAKLDEIKAAGTWKGERIITSPQGAHVKIQGRNDTLLNFCANNYLGLADNFLVIEAAISALKSHGAGLGSVRFICGTQDPHKKLENDISKFHDREDTILYASCFDANAGIFEALLTEEDAVFSDELNHASIIDGIRLCKAKKFRYKHRDMNDLEDKLKQAKDSKLRLIATDGIFSMDGTIAPLKQICELAEQYQALTFIDECHATGCFGANGRGTEEHLGMSGKVDIINSTMGKALGGAAGGYTTGPKELVELLRQKSRPYLFSNSLPPPTVATALKVLEILLASNELPQRVASNTELFRTLMAKAGFTVGGEGHPICPVMLGDARLASQFAEKMLSHGIYVVGFSYPVVPKGKARVRVQISAAHSEEDIMRAVEAFAVVGKELNVL